MKKKKVFTVRIMETISSYSKVVAESKEEAKELALKQNEYKEHDISYEIQEEKFPGLDILIEKGLEHDIGNWVAVRNQHREGFPIDYGYSLIRIDRHAFISGCKDLTPEEINKLIDIRTKTTKEEKEDLLKELERRGIYVNNW